MFFVCLFVCCQPISPRWEWWYTHGQRMPYDGTVREDGVHWSESGQDEVLRLLEVAVHRLSTPNTPLTSLLPPRPVILPNLDRNRIPPVDLPSCFHKAILAKAK